jgi:hypothetical protein
MLPGSNVQGSSIRAPKVLFKYVANRRPFRCNGVTIEIERETET